MLDTNTLELIRKTLFGGPAGGVLDFNAAFSSAPQVTGDNFEALMGALTPGGDPGTNAGINATPNNVSNAVAEALGSIASLGIVSLASPVPGTNAALNSLGLTHNSFLDSVQTLAAAMGIGTASVGTPTAENSIAALMDSNPELNGSVGDGDSGIGEASGSTSTGDTAGSTSGEGDAAGTAYFHGGFVPGPPTGQDKVNINVDGGEVVVPSHIVQMLGTNFFEDLLLNTKSPAVEFVEKQQKEAEKEAKAASKGSK